MTQPNFLIIMTDQQRLDTIGAHGSQICQTPNIDRLAQSATVFDQAYTVTALCTPARASVYTALYPHKHGLVRNEIEFTDDTHVLSQSFRDAGYQCGFVGKWHCGQERLPRDFGFDGMNVPGYGAGTKTPEYQEYLRRNNLEQGEVVPLGLGRWNNVILNGKITGSEEASVPYFLAEHSIDMMTSYQAQGDPFLMFCNFWGPHAPYLPTEPYASMYNPKDIPPWENFEDTFEGKPNAHRRYRDSLLGEGAELRSWDEWSRWVASYYGYVTMIDAQIGRILDALDSSGLADNTVVVFTADHGEHCGAHGGLHDKNAMMYQETYHIPLIVKLPEQTSTSRISQAVTNLDILPTCLDLAGISITHDIDGQSLMPLIQGENKRDDYIFCEFNGHHFLYESRMMTNGKMKFVFNAPEIDELYDLENDPWELHNLASEETYQTTVWDMRERLLRWAEQTDDTLLDWMRNLFVKRDPSDLSNFTPYRS